MSFEEQKKCKLFYINGNNKNINIKCKKGVTMKESIIFITGMILGGIVGIIVMCCLQINKLNELNNE